MSKFWKNELVLPSGEINVGATDVGATDVGATDVGTTNVGATDVGATDVGTTNVGTTNVGATDVGVGATNVGATNVDSLIDPSPSPRGRNPQLDELHLNVVIKNVKELMTSEKTEDILDICNFYLYQDSKEKPLFLISPILLRSLIPLNPLIFLLYREGKIVGSAIVIHLSIFNRKDKKVYKNYHTSFLLIDQHCRKEGLAGLLIREIIEDGKKKGILTGSHFFENQHHLASPLKVYNVAVSTIPVPTLVEQSPSPSQTTTLVEQPPVFKLLPITKETRYTLKMKAYRFWISNPGDVIYPYLKDDFLRWCEVFHVFVIERNDKIEGIFSLSTLNILYQIHQLRNTYLQFFYCKNNEDPDFLFFFASFLYTLLQKEKSHIFIAPQMWNLPEKFFSLFKMEEDKIVYQGIYNLNFLPEKNYSSFL